MPAKKKISQSQTVNKQLETLKESATRQEQVASNWATSANLLDVEPEKRDADTRQRIAKLFISWYFGLLLIIIVGIPIFNVLVQEATDTSDYALDLKEILQVYSSIVGPLVGFVIAYYFKNK